MITETTYSASDLEKGKCNSCGDQSTEILIDDGRCIDCIESQEFIEQTLRHVD